MAKDNRQRHCFVPGCRSGYATPHSKGPKLSLFAVPTDDTRFQAWQRALSRFDKPLQKRCVLCELHFDNRFIYKTYKHTIHGEVVEIPRTRPSLSPDAVPTLFLNPPKPSRVRRQPLRRAAQKPKSYDDAVSEAATNDDDDDSDCSDSYAYSTIPVAEPKRTVTPHIVTARRASPVPAETNAPTLTVLQPLAPMPYLAPPPPCPAPVPQPTPLELEAPAFVASFEPSWLPSRYWTMHHVQHGSHCVAFSFCTLLGGQPTFTKLLACHEERDSKIRCESSIQGVVVRSATVTTALEVRRLVEELDGLKLCEGAATSDEFALSNLPPCKADQGKLHSVSCNRTCPSVSRACEHCKYLRKLLQNKAAYNKRKAGQSPKQPLSDGTVVVEALKTQQPAEHTGEEEWTLECTFYPVS